MKNYLAEQGFTIYSLSKQSGIPYSTLSDLILGKVGIDACRVSLLRKLSETLGIGMDELYRKLSRPMPAFITSYGIEGNVAIRNKSYYAEFVYDDNNIELELCKINEDTSCYIETIARWRTERYIRDKRMEEFR